MQSFLYVSNDIQFQESSAKSAIIEATVLELNKISEQGTEYRISDGARIAKSLIGKNVFYGVNPETGRHRKGQPVGIIENAWQIGRRIKAEITIFNETLIEKLKRGIKFRFSVGGICEFIEVVKKAGRIVKRMVDAVCSHLQILDPTVRVGFPNAEVERILKFNESILLIDHESGLTSDELVLLHLNLSMF